MILEFQTLSDAEAFLLALDDLGAGGYSVWDTVKTSPDQTYYIWSPTGDARFVNWQDNIATDVLGTFVEKEYPASWIVTEPEGSI